MKKLYIALDGGRKLNVGAPQSFNSKVFKLRTVDINQFQAKITVGLIWDDKDYTLHSAYLTNLKPAENGYSYLDCRLTSQGRSLSLNIKNGSSTVFRETFSTLPAAKLRGYILGGLGGLFLVGALIVALLYIDVSSLQSVKNTDPVQRNSSVAVVTDREDVAQNKPESSVEIEVVKQEDAHKQDAPPLKQEFSEKVEDSQPEPVTMVDPKIIVIPLEDRRVYFTANSADITESAEERLNKILAFLLEHPQLHVTITGHCAIAGTEVGRKEISVQRAENVEAWLRRMGWKSDFKPNVRGEAGNYPLTLDPEQQELNRRVEVGINE